MTVDVPGLPIEVDPLIDEANRRKRRRRFLATAALAGVVALAVALTVALRAGGPESPRAGGPTATTGMTSPAEALSRAESLLSDITLPPGAQPLSERAGNAVAGTVQFGTDVFAEFADQHAFWRVRQSLPSVVAFMKEHPPSTFTLRGAQTDGSDPYANVWFTDLSAGGGVPDRINVELVRSNGATIIRGDAGAPWTYPRSRRQLVPATAREVDLSHTWGLHQLLRGAGETRVTRRVTDFRDVALIVSWFNALNVAPHVMVGCANGVKTYVKLTFRSAGGAEIASAFIPGAPASICTVIGFAAHGRSDTRLVDSTPYDGMSFAERLVRLLGR